jgi:glucose-1-phosphate adenylyltransferase
VKIRDSIIMGADFYERNFRNEKGGEIVRLGIGSNSQIRGAIIDKNVRIGHDVVIQPFPPGTEIDAENYVVRDGIVVIPKNTTLPAGTVIAPGKK